MSVPACTGGICAHHGQDGESWAGAQPCLPCLIPDPWAPWKKEGDAHAAAGQLSLFAVGTKEPKRQKWIGLGWAIDGHVCLAAVVRTSEQYNFLVFL